MLSPGGEEGGWVRGVYSPARFLQLKAEGGYTPRTQPPSSPPGDNIK